MHRYRKGSSSNNNSSSKVVSAFCGGLAWRPELAAGSDVATFLPSSRAAAQRRVVGPSASRIRTLTSTSTMVAAAAATSNPNNLDPTTTGSDSAPVPLRRR